MLRAFLAAFHYTEQTTTAFFFQKNSGRKFESPGINQSKKTSFH